MTEGSNKPTWMWIDSTHFFLFACLSLELLLYTQRGIRAANHPRGFSQTESQRILRDLKTPPPLSHSKMTAMFRLTHNLKHSNKGRLVDSEQDLQIGYGAPSLMTRKYRLQSSESKYVHFNTGIMSEIIMHFTSHHSAAWWLHRKVVRL